MKRLLTAALLLPILYALNGQHRGTPFAEANRTKEAALFYVYETVTHSWDLQTGLIYEDHTGQLTGVLTVLMEAFETYLKKEYGLPSKAHS